MKRIEIIGYICLCFEYPLKKPYIDSWISNKSIISIQKYELLEGNT